MKFCCRKDKSCCCYSLDHGAVVIGITFMICSAMAVIIEVGMIAEWEDVKVSFQNKTMRQFVYPFLIVSTSLSFVYFIFSILLLKGIRKVCTTHPIESLKQLIISYFRKENPVLMLPWMIWSVIYILIGLGCAIYELSLGGRIIEVTAVPLMYLVIFSFWAYSVWCIWAFYRTLRRHKPAVNNMEASSPESASLINVHEATLPRIYPHGIWDSPALSTIRKTASFRGADPISVLKREATIREKHEESFLSGTRV